MDKTRQIDRHLAREAVSQLRSPCLDQPEPEQLSGPESPNSLVWAHLHYTSRS